MATSTATTQDITKKSLSDVCKISEVTINKCFKKIDEHKDLFNE